MVDAIGADFTRREFLRGAASLAASRRLPAQARQFAYIASRDGAVHAFAIQNEQWVETQTLPSASPAAMVLHTARKVLYVANDVDQHQGIPCGTVEVFRVRSTDGGLTLVQRRPLSLSATGPRHLAISPDGSLLAVSAYGGGVYNLLPI